MPQRPTPEQRDTERAAWYHALVPILDIAMRDTGEGDEMAESAAINNAMVTTEQDDDPGRHSFRLATTKLLWVAVHELETLTTRQLDSDAAERCAEARAVLETAMQTATMPEFVKAMTYPDGELPSVHALTEAAILATRLRFSQAAEPGQRRKRWDLAADLLAKAGR